MDNNQEARILFSMQADEETETLFRFAEEELGWRVARSVTDLPADCRPVLLAPRSKDARGICRDSKHFWPKDRKRPDVIHAPALVPAERGEGPRFRLALTVREQLRSGAPAGPEGALQTYAADPRVYARDVGEGASRFEARLAGLLGGASRDDVTQSWKEALRCLAVSGRVREFDDLVLAVVPVRFRALAAEAARCVIRARHPWCGGGPALKSRPLVLLFVPDDAEGKDGFATAPPILRVEVWADDPQVSAVREVWRQHAHDTAERHGGPHWDRLIATQWPEPPGDRERQSLRVNALLSALFGGLLLHDRPLRHFGCTFFFPLDPGAESAAKVLEKALESNRDVKEWHYRESEDLTDEERQARLYFLPYFRDLLYPGSGGAATALEPLREWRLDVRKLPWRLERCERHAGRYSTQADVESLRLFRYFNGAYMLAARVRAPTVSADVSDSMSERLNRDTDDWWHALAFSSSRAFARIEQLCLSNWLDYVRLARLLYPTFYEQEEEDKIAVFKLLKGEEKPVCFDPRAKHGNPLSNDSLADLSPIVCAWLKCFFGGPENSAGTDTGKHLPQPLRDNREVYDDRMFVSAAYGLAGPAPRGEDTRRLFSMALFVDRPEDTFECFDGYAYDPEWIDRALENASLGLWEAAGIYSGATSYSNVHLGSGDFFCDIVAPRHIPHAYERMLLQGLFYLASLRRYAGDISLTTGTMVRRGKSLFARSGDFRELRGKFIVFTNRYWFHDLTPNFQGKALFELQQNALGLQREYDLIKVEMERADEFMETARQWRIGQWGIMIALVALWIGLMPMLPSDQTIDLPRLTWDWVCEQVRQNGWRFLYLSLLASMVPLSAYWIIRLVASLCKRARS